MNCIEPGFLELPASKMNVFFGCLVFFFVAVSCNDSNSAHIKDKSQHTSDSIAPQKKEVLIQGDSAVVDNAPILNIAFLESLESGWDGSYQQSRLAQRGFKLTSTEIIEKRRILIFENVELDNRITLGRITYPDGETEFSVEYKVKKDQFYRFKEQLPNSSYKNQRHGIFVKKGQGTYASKTIAAFAIGFSIVYIHSIGGELYTPILLPSDTINTIPRLEMKTL